MAGSGNNVTKVETDQVTFLEPYAKSLYSAQGGSLSATPIMTKIWLSIGFLELYDKSRNRPSYYFREGIPVFNFIHDKTLVSVSLTPSCSHFSYSFLIEGAL